MRVHPMTRDRTISDPVTLASRDEGSDKVRRRYDRTARLYDALDRPMELTAFRRWRPLVWEALGEAPGRVLEVGVGTGKNLPHYRPGVPVTAIDLSPRMLDRARARAERLGVPVDLRLMDVEHLELSDHGFRSAFATFVFCSVAHPVAGLRELRRVLEPGGRLVLLEHQRSASRFLAPILDLLDPLMARLWGAHANRRTEENVRAAGFTVERSRWLTPKGLVRLITARA